MGLQADMQIKEKPKDFKVKEVPNLTLTPTSDHQVFRLKKKDRNTEGAVRDICKALNISRKRVGYAGNKDKNAVTEQYISIKNVKRSDVEDLALENINLKYMGRSDQPIRLGDHLGNEFEIVVRECEEAPEEIERVVNYFGEQRFSHNNAEVGKAVIKGDWKKACELVEESGGRNARVIKEHLEKNENDYLGALKKLPKKTASLLVHSYQSRLWNEVAEELADKGFPNINVPIVGFRTEFENEEVKNLYQSIMKRENVSKRDFLIRQWPAITADGSKRKLYVPLQNLNIEEISKETYRVSFYLPKGAYATVAINHLFPE